MIVAKILKYEPVCSSFVGAITSVTETPSLVPLVDGKPKYPKGSLVAYEETALRYWKGRAVRGNIKTISEVVLSEVAASITPDDIGRKLEEADGLEDWGL